MDIRRRQLAARAVAAAGAVIVLVAAGSGPGMATARPQAVGPDVATTQPALPWLPLAEVRPGMRGEARTVVRGVAVESFPVEVIAIVPGAGPSGDLILIRASGALIERTSGIAAGMSGSPVYLKGRIAGAIGFGWNFADHRLGLVTPIEAMLRALPSPKRAGAPADWRPLPRPLSVAGRRVTAVVVASSASVATAIQARSPHVLPMVPLARPLLLSGASGRMAQFLRAELDPLGITPVEGAIGASTDARPALVPGSAIGVQIMRGDLNAVAIGTLTYRQGDHIVAFGHPFVNRGRSAFLLVPAVIHEVVRSAAFPFKVGSAGAPVGSITEDRRAGIGGRIGTLPSLVGVRVRIIDRDRARKITIGTQVVADRHLGPLLVLASAMEALDRALDRVGEGTARVRFSLRGRGLDEPVTRDNVFYHARDIGAAALLELPEALRLLFANEFTRTGPVDITVDVDVEQTRQTATLTAAAVPQPRVRRGDALPVRVTLRPFQGAPVIRTLEVVVPEAFPTGSASLVVRAGGRAAPEQALPALLTAEPTEVAAASATAQLENFSDRDRNTDLIIELIPGAARIPDGSGDAPVQAVRVRTGTAWVVRGRLQVPVIIDSH